MPKVGGKKFPYTAAGMKAAKKAAKKTGKKMAMGAAAASSGTRAARSHEGPCR